MAEKTFIDRHARSFSMRDFTAGFSPVFAPADASLTAANFGTFLGTVGTLNTNILAQQGTYKTQATSRLALLKTILSATTQALARLKSNAVWGAEFKSAKQVADKLRGKRPAKPKLPEEGEPPVEGKKRNSGEQAYAEAAALFEKFIGILTATAAYSTGVPAAISLGTLNGQLSGFKGLNSGLCTLAASIVTNQKKRLQLYFETGGLQEKFQSVKNAVKSQYGQNGPEYASVKGIRW